MFLVRTVLFSLTLLLGVASPLYSASVAQQAKKMFQCAFAPGKNNCSEEETSAARKKIAGITLGAAAATAAAVTVGVSVNEIYKRQAEVKKQEENDAKERENKKWIINQRVAQEQEDRKFRQQKQEQIFNDLGITETDPKGYPAALLIKIDSYLDKGMDVNFVFAHDPEHPNQTAFTLMDVAVRGNSPEKVKKLLDRGAEKSLTLETMDSLKKNAAANNPKAQEIEVLLGLRKEQPKAPAEKTQLTLVIGYDDKNGLRQTKRIAFQTPEQVKFEPKIESKFLVNQDFKTFVQAQVRKIDSSEGPISNLSYTVLLGQSPLFLLNRNNLDIWKDKLPANE